VFYDDALLSGSVGVERIGAGLKQPDGHGTKLRFRVQVKGAS
jgi:hypothetical protein